MDSIPREHPGRGEPRALLLETHSLSLDSPALSTRPAPEHGRSCWGLLGRPRSVSQAESSSVDKQAEGPTCPGPIHMCCNVVHRF